jgi:hypothetical protein
MVSKNKEFLGWLSKRLTNKYQEDKSVIDNINSLSDNFFIIPKKIPLTFIDQLCKKHFPDFDMDKCAEFRGGFDEDERRKIRSIVIETLTFAENSEPQ